jgi:hypothetical protein
MKKMNVYTAVDLIPNETNVISSRWVFKFKGDPEEKISLKKAKLVPCGFTQQ